MSAPDRIWLRDEGPMLGWCDVGVANPAGLAEIDPDVVEYVRADLAHPKESGHEERSSGQWCELHGVHQDDLRHCYSSACEGHHREATVCEEADVRVRLDASPSSHDENDR